MNWFVSTFGRRRATMNEAQFAIGPLLESSKRLAATIGSPPSACTFPQSSKSRDKKHITGLLSSASAMQVLERMSVRYVEEHEEVVYDNREELSSRSSTGPGPGQSNTIVSNRRFGTFWVGAGSADAFGSDEEEEDDFSVASPSPEWDVGQMGRAAAEALLADHAAGTMLTRLSANKIVLSVRRPARDGCSHIQILEDEDGRFRLCSEERFATVNDLVSFYLDHQGVFSRRLWGASHTPRLSTYCGTA